MGDYLVVSVTADKFVRKGPGRPVFSLEHRVHMLQALSCVDLVLVSHADDARSVIATVKPDIYAKGADYQVGHDGDGSAFQLELAILRSNTGEVRFTNGVTGSSSALLNQLTLFPDATTRYLADVRQFCYERDCDIDQCIDQLGGLDVLLIGDNIMDQYVTVQALTMSPRASHPAYRHLGTATYPGGVRAVANHLDTFVNEVTIITSDSYILKTRYVLPDGAKQFGVQTFPDCKIEDPGLQRERILDAARNVDIVMVLDYGHGFVPSQFINEMSQPDSKYAGLYYAVNCQTNSANYGLNLATRKYKRSDYLCLDEPELSLALSRPIDAITLGPELNTEIFASTLMVTRGAAGSAFITQNGVEYTPALALKVLDRVGAGDALFAITSPLLALGFPPFLVGFLGNLMAAIQCGIVANSRPVTKAELKRAARCILAGL